MVKQSLVAEANSNVQYIRWHFSEGLLYDSKIRHTHKRTASPQHATDHGDRGARGSSGSCSANGRWGCRIFANYCYSVRGCARGANLRPNLETTSGEEMPCPYLSLRSGRNTPFRWIFRSWKLSEPTFVSTCSVHRSHFRRILYRSRSLAYIGIP